MQSEKMSPIVPRTIVYKILFIIIFVKKHANSMNKIIPISIEYLSPSRTLEILNLVRFEGSKQVYVYNFEGNHFRFFDSLEGLIQFFEIGKEAIASFSSEKDLDHFLDKFQIVNSKRI
jgi:hypothetical protein